MIEWFAEIHNQEFTKFFITYWL